MKFLNVTEWLEAKRIEGCDFASELLEIVDGVDDAIADAEALDELYERAPYLVNGSELERHDRARLVEWIIERLDLLETLESKIDKPCEGMTFPKGTRLAKADDKLEAMLNSDRWLGYDL